ncbi:hypothetical protein LOC68_10880 [Blastopirellula sp. JC732]|uniref:Uncharacterized protein n=1 Tax=Blastopirellula sediminis TaxID=2894196 RepID=A0A9X1SJH7_9BACT|nr:hypothetical protein [Blastopirellula sediminis]MCC9628904.1 hypothetical protein [Blastopirellula sediminis]
MSRLFPRQDRDCVPLVIGDGDSESGSRLGGLPPAGVTPNRLTSLTKYFCTIRVAEDPVLEISVFLSFDFAGMADGAGVVHTSGDLFEVVTHGDSTRSIKSALASELTPHPILHGQECADKLVDDDGNEIVISHHKLGGRPFIQDSGEGLPALVRSLREEGYFQIVQIAFPDAHDGDVDGDWPFAVGMFHLFGEEPIDKCSWRCFWEY